jgi:DNA polymerase III delta subunit
MTAWAGRNSTAATEGSVPGAQVLKGLKGDSLATSYFLAGGSAWLRGRLVARLREVAVPESWRNTAVETVWGGETAEVDAADTAATPPFGSPRRMLVIRSLEGFRPRKKGQRKASTTPADSPLAAYLRSPSPTTVLVMVSEERSFSDWEGDPILKAARGSGVLVACDPPEKAALTGWLAELASASGLKLAPGVADELVERSLGDQLRLEHELEKISLWGGAGAGPVTLEQVDLLTGEGAPPDIFNFLDILFVDRHAGKALAMLALLLNEMHPLQLHAMMATQMRKLIALKQAVREDWPQGRIAREIKFPFFLVGRLTMVVNRTRMERFAELLGALAAAEASLKRGGNGRRVLEGFVLEVCGRG